MAKKQLKNKKISLIMKDSQKNLGNIGDLVSVKPGYARNFLLPQGKAIIATKENITYFENQKDVIATQKAKELELAKEKSLKIDAIGSLSISHNAGEDGKLFGSVTEKDIALLFANEGIDISYRDISFKGAIKRTGEYTIAIYLHSEVTSSVVLEVKKKQ